MKITVILDVTKECLGVVYGQTLEECLAEAVRKAGRPLKHLANYPDGTVAIMERRRKQGS